MDEFCELCDRFFESESEDEPCPLLLKRNKPVCETCLEKLLKCLRPEFVSLIRRAEELKKTPNQFKEDLKKFTESLK